MRLFDAEMGKLLKIEKERVIRHCDKITELDDYAGKLKNEIASLKSTIDKLNYEISANANEKRRLVKQKDNLYSDIADRDFVIGGLRRDIAQLSYKVSEKYLSEFADDELKKESKTKLINVIAELRILLAHTHDSNKKALHTQLANSLAKLRDKKAGKSEATKVSVYHSWSIHKTYYVSEINDYVQNDWV